MLRRALLVAQLTASAVQGRAVHPAGTVVMVPARSASPAADICAGSNNRLPCGAAAAAAAGWLLSASAVDSLRASAAVGIELRRADKSSVGSGRMPDAEFAAGDSGTGAASCCSDGRCSDQLTRDLRPPSNGIATLRGGAQQADRQQGQRSTRNMAPCTSPVLSAAQAAGCRLAVSDFKGSEALLHPAQMYNFHKMHASDWRAYALCSSSREPANFSRYWQHSQAQHTLNPLLGLS